MTRAQRVWAGIALALTLGVTLAASACGVGTLDVTNRPCPCGTGFVCDPSRNTCVTPSQLALDSGTPTPTEAGPGPCLGANCACASATDCKDPAYTKCVDKKCVECTSGPDTCAAGSYCLATHECAPGCKADAECKALSPSAPFCNIGRHQCVNCAVDKDCTNGQKCSPAGACVDACSAGTCPGGKSCCNNLCLDTTSDPLNCNACGNACTGAQTACCAGTCTDPLTTPTSCGQCGNACSTVNGSPSCSAGTCKWGCNAGFNHCAAGNTGCETSTSSNTTQCGSCTTNCNTNVKNAAGVACVGSACTYATCNATFSDCDGNKANGCECTTPPNCGALLQLCCAGNICNQGLKCEVAPANDGKCH